MNLLLQNFLSRGVKNLFFFWLGSKFLRACIFALRHCIGQGSSHFLTWSWFMNEWINYHERIDRRTETTKNNEESIFFVNTCIKFSKKIIISCWSELAPRSKQSCCQNHPSKSTCLRPRSKIEKRKTNLIFWRSALKCVCLE